MPQTCTAHAHNLHCSWGRRSNADDEVLRLLGGLVGGPVGVVVVAHEQAVGEGGAHAHKGVAADDRVVELAALQCGTCPPQLPAPHTLLRCSTAPCGHCRV